jgi:O-antigen/teichoic acid export membrane protein
MGGRALRGAFWAYGSYIGGRLLVLIAVGILARLLTPEDFGLVAIGMIVISLLETVKDLGLTQALVISDDEDLQESADTVFTVAMMAGGVLALVSVGAGLLAARFYSSPELAGLIAVLGANFLIRGVSLTHYAIAQKQLRFNIRTTAELASVIVRGVGSIALALLGFGAWSLVLGFLMGSLVFSIVLFLLVDYRPHLRISRSRVAGLVRFGGTLTGVDVLSAVAGATPDLIVGRTLGTAAVGFYTLALRIPELAVLNLANVAGQVFFPAFAKLGAANLRRAFLTAQRYVLIFALPVSCGVILLAAPIVEVVFGSQWTSSIGPMRLLTLYALGITCATPAGVVLKATGRAGTLLRMGLFNTVAITIAVLAVAHMGIVQVAAAVAVVTWLTTAIFGVIAMRMLGVGVMDLARAGAPAAMGTVAVAAALIATLALGAPALVTLLVGTALGTAAFGAALWLADREVIFYLVRTARSR